MGAEEFMQTAAPFTLLPVDQQPDNWGGSWRGPSVFLSPTHVLCPNTAFRFKQLECRTGRSARHIKGWQSQEARRYFLCATPRTLWLIFL
jgi:hypothetical protein